MLIWLQFMICAGVILFAGKRLSKYGDIIADRTGLGQAWIGVVLMASVTSLPELITGVSSVTLFDVPDIAAGDVLGSCMFNILIIALLDLFDKDVPVLSRTEPGQILTGAFGILLLGAVCVGIGAGGYIPTLGWIGLYSIVFMCIYLIAMRTIFLFEKRRMAEIGIDEDVEFVEDELTNSRLYMIYAINAGLVIIAATILPYIGEEIAKMTGLGHTFVGSLFIAFSTSLPEMVVAVSALRLGAVDMAVGNLLGSNLFNIGILAVDDAFYRQGPLLQAITSAHLITAIAAIVMTACAIAGLVYREEHKRFRMGWDTLAILMVYLAATYLLANMV
jgi:cation:H+ antiporter